MADDARTDPTGPLHEPDPSGPVDLSALSDLTHAASELFSARRVFGEPYEHAGTLVVPVARITGSHGIAGAQGKGRASVRKAATGTADGTPDADGEQPEAPAPAPQPADAGGGPGAWPAHRSPWHGAFGHGRPWPFGGGRPASRGSGQADAGGFAGHVKPLGVYVISAHGVRWKPALDLNRVILGGQTVGVVALLSLAWAARRRRR